MSVTQAQGDTTVQRAILSTADNIEEVVKLLVNEGAQIDSQDESGRTALMSCLTYGVDEYIPVLMELHASLWPTDVQGRTALHYAVEEANSDACELLALIDEESELSVVNELDREGYTALSLAVKSQDEALVAALLRHSRIDVNTPDAFGVTPIMSSVLLENHSLIDRLLDAGADPTICTHSGLNVLFSAVDREDIRIVESLTQPGRWINACGIDGNTMLHWAVIKYAPNIVGILLSKGADVTLANQEGHTPVVLAEAYGFQSIYDQLIAHHDTSGPQGLPVISRRGTLDRIEEQPESLDSPVLYTPVPGADAENYGDDDGREAQEGVEEAEIGAIEGPDVDRASDAF